MALCRKYHELQRPPWPNRHLLLSLGGWRIELQFGAAGCLKLVSPNPALSPLDPGAVFRMRRKEGSGGSSVWGFPGLRWRVRWVDCAPPPQGGGGAIHPPQPPAQVRQTPNETSSSPLSPSHSEDSTRGGAGLYQLLESADKSYWRCSNCNEGLECHVFKHF